MRKVLESIGKKITDRGRCDDPRDHIWHTLDIYHYLDIGPGSDENGINAMLNNNPNVLLQVGRAVAWCS